MLIPAVTGSIDTARLVASEQVQRLTLSDGDGRTRTAADSVAGVNDAACVHLR